MASPPPTPDPNTLQSPGIHVSLTHLPLSPLTTLSHVRSPHAGATTLFSGTTRDTFNALAVLDLHYQAYVPMALATLNDIATTLRKKHDLIGVAIVHRLGAVPVGEESVLIAVSSAHRLAAWRAGEECLEEVKRRAEIWKLERFVGDEGGVWRANRDGVVGVREEVGGKGGEGGKESGKSEEKRADEAVKEGLEGKEQLLSGPVVRPRRPGESGHGAVVNPKPRAPPE